MSTQVTRRRRATVAGSAAFSAVIATSLVAAAGAEARTVKPNATARSHGIQRIGDATMGWEAKTPATPAPRSGANPKLSARALAASSTTVGLDLSAHTQGERWSTWKANGVRFAYIKASEGTYYTSPAFNRQYIGANQAGVLRGAYHFANPTSSNGATQADYFIAHGGGWSPDGRTLPGALDMEWNPYTGNSCYDKTPAQLQQFVADFVGRYKQRTGTRPIIYTASLWWNKCMGSTPKWTSTPLWIADYHSTLGALPAAWSKTTHKIWQNAAYNAVGYDTDLFNGTEAALAAWARKGS